jgi:hypothetical protein
VIEFEDYKNIGVSRGISYTLDYIPKLASISVLGWKCNTCQYEWKTGYSCIKQGTGCPRCAGKLPKTLEDYKKIGLNRGIEYILDYIPKSAATRIQGWKCTVCPEKYEFETSYKILNKGCGCPNCSKRVKKDINHYKNIGLSRGIEYFLDYIPKEVRISIKGWRCTICPEKYEWKACFSSIQQGTGCPRCAGIIPKKIEDYHKICKEKPISYVLNYIPKSNQIPIKGWKCHVCPEGKNIWKASYGHIKGGTGCPNCAGTIPKKIEDYHEICKGKLISYVLDYIPKSADIPVKGWKCHTCPEGKNTWQASYGGIQQGHGCPNCCKSRSEKLCRTYFEEALMSDFPSCRPNFLKYPKTGFNLELDGYNEEYKIAFEYHGKHHYEQVLYFQKTKEKFNLQQERDQWKKKRCEELGIKLIIIPYYYDCYNPEKLRNFIYDELFKIC